MNRHLKNLGLELVWDGEWVFVKQNATIIDGTDAPTKEDALRAMDRFEKNFNRIATAKC